MSTALQSLRRNDPQRYSIEIDLNHEEDDAAIARALEQNPYVSRVWLNLAQRISSWDHLYRVLATRGNLEQFGLANYTSPPVRAARIVPIIQAINQNTSIRVVEFRCMTFEAEDLCSFLDSAVHITDLMLDRCHLTVGEHGVRDVAAALQRNTNIVSLKLVLFINDFLDSILQELVLNTCVRNFALETDSLQEASSNALQGILEVSTGSIQHFELIGTRLREESFRPVALGLINGSTVTSISFEYCSFCDEGSIHLLNQILQRKLNLHSLAIKDCEFYARRPQFLQALFSALRRPDSPMRHFQYDTKANFPEQSFRVLLEAVSESKLESLSIGRAGAPPLYICPLQIVANAIPTMKLRVLTVQFGHLGSMDRARIQQTLRQAVKDNYTLQSVKYQFGVRNPSDASEDDETFQFYLQRNIRLAQWAENPATVPKHLWKEATTLATKAEPTMLFRLLRKIGPEVLPVGRKRKREG